MAIKTVSKGPLLPPAHRKVKRRVKRIKRPEAIDVEAIEISESRGHKEEHKDYSSILVAIAMGMMLGYSILALGKLGALLAFALGATYLIKEVILK